MWFKLIVLGILGFLVAGPAGAALGLVFALTAGRLRSSHRHRGRADDDLDAQFLTCVFSMVAKLARADGAISQDEIALTNFFMDEVLKLDTQRKAFAIGVFREAKDSSSTFGAYAAQFQRLFEDHPHMLHIMMDTLFKIAAVDGTLHPEEERLLHSAAQIFNIPEQDYQAILASFLGHGPYQGQERGADPGRASNQARDAYQVLGLSPESSDEEVKKTYRSLVAKFHPDKIASKDLPEEFNAFAHAKFKEIQEAYERIKTERGI